MSARDDILASIRQSLAGSTMTEPVPRDYRQETEHAPGSEPVIEEMIDVLEDYTAIVTRVTENGIPQAISNFLEDCTSVVVPHGLPDTWKAAAGEGRTVREDSRENGLSNYELDKIDAVVTGSRVGISLSGTIILDGEPDQGRRAITLVPDTHVTVLYEKDIYPTVPQAVAVLEQFPDRPTTWIAGPSATSDIELVRVDGVHGPRNLRVILVK